MSLSKKAGIFAKVLLKATQKREVSNRKKKRDNDMKQT
jgi:hypothetical protein